MKKTHVAFVFGGRTSEHEVSLLSAKNIIDATDKDLFDVTLIGVDKHGTWRVYNFDHYLDFPDSPTKISLAPTGHVLGFSPGAGDAQIIDLQTGHPLPKPDVFFPIIHGTYGEDGSLQGFFNILGIPFVGSDVLSSAICMDKDIAKRLLRDAGLNVAPYAVFDKIENANFIEMSKLLGLPLFVKPANQGSSVGVSKATDKLSFDTAIRQAFSFDDKVLIETAVLGREIECAVLGNDAPRASVCGEIISAGGFYSYDAKYIDADSAKIIIPADVDEKLSDSIRMVALEAFQILGCKGLARIDLFLEENGRITINEVNTLPGFTNISMYPKLWEETKISYSDLITALIRHALQ